MIRLRDNKGNLVEFDDVSFIEICDSDGNVHNVVYENIQDGFNQITPDSAEAKRYSQLFKVNFSNKVINIKL